MAGKERLGYSREELIKMRVPQLKALLQEFGLTAHGCLEKQDFVDRLISSAGAGPEPAGVGTTPNSQGDAKSAASPRKSSGQQAFAGHRKAATENFLASHRPQAEAAAGQDKTTSHVKVGAEALEELDDGRDEDDASTATPSAEEPKLERSDGGTDTKESPEELLKMSVSKLKELMHKAGLSLDGCLEKSDFVERLTSQARRTQSKADAETSNTQPQDDEDITVTIRTSAMGAEDWQLMLKVPAQTHIGAFRSLLSTSPNDLPVTLRTRFLCPDTGKTLPNSQQVLREMVLMNFHPERIDVRVRSSAKGTEKWYTYAEVELGTTVQDFLSVLREPPHSLELPNDQTVWQRPLHYNSFTPAKAAEPVLSEVVLIDFLVPDSLQAKAAEERETPATSSRSQPTPDQPATEKTFTNGSQKSPDQQSVVSEKERASSIQPRSYWRSLRKLCTELEETHATQGPRTRRAFSWARTLAYAKIGIGDLANTTMRKGTPEAPFVYWVIGATDMTEAYLAEQGFFDDSNWVDWAPSEVYIFGEGLRELSPSAERATEGYPPVVRTMSYKDMARERARCPPDLVAVFMPHFPCPQVGVRDWETASGWSPVPKTVLEHVGSAPIIFTFRCQLPESAMHDLREELDDRLLLDQTRCPFSSSAGAPDVQFDDNGWLIAVRGHSAASTVLASEVEIAAHRPIPETVGSKEIVLFWGIIDLKYDPTLPVLERVKVLETGDGKLSKFSNDGAPIKEMFDQLYMSRPGPAAHKYVVVSSDKKLTHDLIDKSGYGHILPKQVCFPRRYASDLAKRITQGLGVSEDKSEIVVLKLCNRTRGAGVLVVPVPELDSTIEDILNPPGNIDSWLKEGTDRILMTSASDLGLEKSVFDEHSRHWWGNESPVFVAEKYCTSIPTQRNGKGFDGTLRVSFVIKHKKQASDEHTPSNHTRNSSNGVAAAESAMPPPEELEVEWLGGYWKLPRADTEADDIRMRTVSAARSGTAPVRPEHLQQVYASLGDSMQQLFGGAEPMPQELISWYKSNQPELAAFLIARLGMTGQRLDLERAHGRLNIAQAALAESDETARQCVSSYLSRAHGICEIKPNAHVASHDRWLVAEEHFRRSVELLPHNANALFLLGMAALEFNRLSEAVELMNRSLLLDPDFRGPYVNLGVAYLRQGKYHKTIEISNAGLARHPDTPMCNYHIGVASYQTAVRMYEQPDETVVANGNLNELLELSLGLALDELVAARKSYLGEKRAPTQTGRYESPWLEADDQMLAEARDLSNALSPAPRNIALPPSVGWRLFHWRA